MKALFFMVALFFVSSCGSENLSEKIKDSQINQYKEMDKMRLEFMNTARKYAFEKLSQKGLCYSDNSILYLIEAYDITNGILDAVIIVDENIIYYSGDHFENLISLSEEPTIDKHYIEAYISGNYNSLSDSLRISSTGYIGSTVYFEGKLKISHYRW